MVWPMSVSSTGPVMSSRPAMPAGSITNTPSTGRPVDASYIWAMTLPTLGMSAGMVTLLQYFTEVPPLYPAP